MCAHIADLELRKPIDRRNQITIIGMDALKQNLRMTIVQLRTILLLSATNSNNTIISNDVDNRIGLIEQLEHEISSRMYNGEGSSNDDQVYREMIHIELVFVRVPIYAHN